MRRERKAIFEIEGQGKVRVKGYKQGFLKIVFRKSFQSNGHAKVSSYSPSTALIPSCQACNLVSYVHHVSVPGSVADTHNSNKIDIKNHTFIANGENILHGFGCIAWA